MMKSLILSLALVFGLFMGSAAIAEGQNASGPQLPDGFPITFGGPFSLTDHTGKAVTDKDFHGKFMLIYFGYTFCPDICPTNLQTMADALDQLGAKEKYVQPVFITIDPARDTSKLLKDYVKAFYPSMVGLTGTEAQIKSVANAYRQHRQIVPTEETKKDPNDYLVAHSSITFLMGPDGKFVTLFPHDTKAEFMAKVMAKYLKKAAS
jgi:cytochrome oxidase Cu insertion factor (SCO1/SenC/PrrC family)